MYYYRPKRAVARVQTATMGINPWRNNRIRVVIRRNPPESSPSDQPASESTPSSPAPAPLDSRNQPAPDPVLSVAPATVPVPNCTIGPRCDTSIVINPECCCTLDLFVSEGSDNRVYAFINVNKLPSKKLVQCNANKKWISIPTPSR